MQPQPPYPFLSLLFLQILAKNHSGTTTSVSQIKRPPPYKCSPSSPLRDASSVNRKKQPPLLPLVACRYHRRLNSRPPPRLDSSCPLHSLGLIFEDALRALSKLTMEFPSLIVQATIESGWSFFQKLKCSIYAISYCSSNTWSHSVYPSLKVHFQRMQFHHAIKHFVSHGPEVDKPETTEDQLERKALQLTRY